jgi:hypothetical protein
LELRNLWKRSKPRREKGRLRTKIKPEIFLEVASRIPGNKIKEVVGAGKERERLRAYVSYLSLRARGC